MERGVPRLAVLSPWGGEQRVCLQFSPLVQHRERGISGRDEDVSEDILWDIEKSRHLDIKEGLSERGILCAPVQFFCAWELER